MSKIFLLFCIFGLLGTTVSLQNNQAEPNTLTPNERTEGWKLLFDGQTTDE